MAGEKEVAVQGRDISAPRPKMVDPDEVPQSGDVVNFRVGSEAAVEEGEAGKIPLQPLQEATRIRNSSIRERHQKELERRGLAPVTTKDGRPAPQRSVSVTFEGNMMVEVDDDESKSGIKSGSFSGNFAKTLVVRPLTQDEEKQLNPGGGAIQRRSTDLVAGSGTGGGGNPMAAGDTRGTSSVTAGPVAGQAPRSPVGTQPGTTTKTSDTNPKTVGK